MDGMIQFYIETTNIPVEHLRESNGRTFINGLGIAQRSKPDSRGNTLSVFVYSAATHRKVYVGSGRPVELVDDGGFVEAERRGRGPGSPDQGGCYSMEELYGLEDAIIVHPKNMH